MSIWAHIEATIYFKEPITINQLQELQPSLIIHPKPKYSNAKKGDYTFKNHFIGSEGGCIVRFYDEKMKAVYIEGNLRDEDWKWDEDMEDIFTVRREEWRKILKAWIKLIEDAEFTNNTGDNIHQIILNKKHKWRESIIYEYNHYEERD